MLTHPPQSFHCALNKEQIRTIMQLNPKDPVNACIMMALLLSLRPAEAPALCWGDYRREYASIRIHQQMVYDKKAKQYFIKPTTKNFKPRTAIIGNFATEMLDVTQKCQKEAQLICGKHWQNDSNLIFVHNDNNGSPITPRELETALAKIMKENHLPPARMYDLRHTTSTVVAHETGNPRFAQKLDGHANINTTIRYYIDRDSKGKRIAAEAREKYYKEVILGI